MTLLRLAIILCCVVPLIRAGVYERCGIRACGLNAHCDVSGKRPTCVCDPGYAGEPLIECYNTDESEYQCVVCADPHLNSFSNAHADLNYPCKYRLTRVQTNLKWAVPGASLCAFEVFGYNEVINGNYYTSAMEIAFAITDLANQFHRADEIIKFGINKDGIADSGGQATTWGSGVHGSFNNITVECEFDEHQRLAILNIPRCHFKATFRPWNDEESEGPQSQVPCISIIVGHDTYFGRVDTGRYPWSLCGEGATSSDDQDLYQLRAEYLRLQDASQALLYDALNQNLNQSSPIGEATDEALQDAEECQLVVDAFQHCNKTQKKQVIDVCYTILSRHQARCMGIHALAAFRNCVEAVCTDETTAHCARARKVFRNNNCKVTKDLRRFCNN